MLNLPCAIRSQLYCGQSGRLSPPGTRPGIYSTEGQVKVMAQHTASATEADNRSQSRLAAKTLYGTLLNEDDPQKGAVDARDFLNQLLCELPEAETMLPASAQALPDWLLSQHHQVGNAYIEYLMQRRLGAPRRLFTSRAHALDYIEKVSPTKLVDGAWLYGTLRFWRDPRFRPLIDTYLEELGSGQSQLNHIVIYKQLLAKLQCRTPSDLEDDNYLQGAIQLALGCQTAAFLPELLGYNLGYELPPLHLLITCQELAELGINPAYFRLHVTIDNADTGHAAKAIDAVRLLMPIGKQASLFYQRVKRGFLLNQMGRNPDQVLASFNPEAKLISLLERKARFGKGMHAEHCQLAGRSINDWLSQPEQIPSLIQVLQQKGWIRRHQNPQQSPFWRLINGDTGDMFGVFSAPEQQLIYEWIAGDWLSHEGPIRRTSGHASSAIDYARLPRERVHGDEAEGDNVPFGNGPEQDANLTALQRDLAAAPDKSKMPLLIAHMSPALHSRPVGLWATRSYAASL